jgi:hypothetical protein
VNVVDREASRELLAELDRAYSGAPEAATLVRSLAERFDEPLRVALTGMVKAGKSTLLNAMVGEEIAPTDAAECTRVVTWYRYGATRRVAIHLRDGSVGALPVTRMHGRLDIRLDGVDLDSIDRIVVDWPSRALRSVTLIDTPGVGSLSPEVVARSRRVLTPDAGPSDADALIYLMRHMHPLDLEVISAFQKGIETNRPSVSTIAVLSRADEIGAGRLDALLSARGIADRQREGGVLKSLTLGISPVAGLLAQSAKTLRQAEHRTLSELAATDRRLRARALRSVDLFVASTSMPGTPETRRALVDRFGVFGVRLAIAILESGDVDAPTLARELTRRSGLDELVRAVDQLFTERTRELKSRALLAGVRDLLRRHPLGSGEPVGADADADEVATGQRIEALIERIEASAHELTELQLISAARTSGLPLPRRLAAEAEQVLGGRGTDVRTRLGLSETAGDEEVLDAATATAGRWSARRRSATTGPEEADVCAAVVRSCEAIIVSRSSGHRFWGDRSASFDSQAAVDGSAPVSAAAAASSTWTMSSPRM